MARDSEREIFDGCSRPRLTPLTRSEAFLDEQLRKAKEEARREVAEKVGGMVDWTKLYDHRSIR